ncbi:MAG: hypothetical protein SGJ20_05720 [Planctomycetota bacterium]|nr:hypothetical protein [Planctomycetota bacterium]
MMFLNKLLTGVFLLTVAFASTCTAQSREVAIYTRTDVRDLVQRMEQHSNAFRKHFEKALDRSALNDTDREDRLRRWTQDLEDMLDHLKKDQSKNQIRDMEQRINTMLAIAAGINRIMLYRTFSADAERDWRLLRADLNALALTYDLPTLQDYRVRNYPESRR